MGDKSQFEKDKIMNVLLYVLQHFPEGIELERLYVILYNAQKMHLTKYGSKIFEDDFVARDSGPVPECIDNEFKRLLPKS